MWIISFHNSIQRHTMLETFHTELLAKVWILKQIEDMYSSKIIMEKNAMIKMFIDNPLANLCETFDSKEITITWKYMENKSLHHHKT